MQTQLIVNADDFGFTRGTNLGIVDAHRNGILTATTLMAYGAAFDHAVDLARATPSLDVGVHLVLWDDDSAIPQRLPAFVHRAMGMSTHDIERLFASQVQRVVDAGIAPTHLDTHKHTHTLPHVMRAVERTALRFGVGWVRRPFVRMWPGERALRSTDHFMGLSLTGRLTTASLSHELTRLKPGLTELMCHPARYDVDLESAPTRLKHERQRELDALIAPEIRAQLVKAEVQLTNYRLQRI